MPATKLPETRARPIGAVGIIGDGRAAGVAKAHMHVDPVADARRIAQRGVADGLVHAAGNRPGQFAHDHRLVRTRDAGLRPHGDLVLVDAVFLHERVGLEAGLAHGAGERLAEGFLRAQAGERVAAAERALHALEMKLVLECADQRQARHVVEPGKRVLEDRAGAAFPRCAVGLLDVADDEMLRRPAVLEVEPHPWSPGSGIMTRSPSAP